MEAAKYKIFATSCLLLLVTNTERSFVDTAAIHHANGNINESDQPVQELENLKHLLEKTASSGKDIIISKIQSSVIENINGHKTGHAETQNTVENNGKIVAKVSQKLNISEDSHGGEPKVKTETEVDIPSKGIQKTIVREDQGGLDYSNNNNQRTPEAQMDTRDTRDATNVMAKINSYAGGIEYSPLDMAEYVFWTGDEKGVTLAIEEFLEEGLMSKDEAINFLQSIKSNLDYMQAHYQGLHKVEENIANKLQERVQKLLIPEKSAQLSSVDYDAQSPAEEEARPNPFFKAKSQEPQDYYTEKKKRLQSSDEDYEELLERLRVADFLYTEYSLEEVIYQLAKVMFSQSLTRGSREAQLALHRFTGFLEKEADNGQISRTLEKKILDVLIAALADTLAEHPELLSTAREGLSTLGSLESTNTIMLKQLLHNAAQPVFPGSADSGKLSSLKHVSSQPAQKVANKKM